MAKITKTDCASHLGVEPLQEQTRETPGPPFPVPGIEYAALTQPVDKPGASASAVPAYIATPADARSLKKPYSGKEKWLFRGINLLLATFMIFFGIRIVANFYEKPHEPSAAATPSSAPDSATKAVETAEPDRPLSDYRVILDRNLFGSARHPETDAVREAPDLKTVVLAGNEVGLKLIGTAVTRDRRQNYAVLELTRTRSQSICREKEVVENVLIKHIFRNNVIISTASGDQRLSVDEKLTPGTKGPPVQPVAAGLNFPEVPRAEVENTESTFKLSIGDIAQTLSGLEQMLEESNSSPHMHDGKPDGFTLGRLRAHDPYFRIGLRTGDIIKSIDGEAVESPDDAKLLIERLAQGGDFSILIERRGRMHKLKLSLN